MLKYCGNARGQYYCHFEDQKKKNAEKNWQPKSDINTDKGDLRTSDIFTEEQGIIGYGIC